MPQLDTDIHVKMLKEGFKTRSPRVRLKRFFRKLSGRSVKNPIALGATDIYGLEWGDPDKKSELKAVRDHFLLPYVNASATCLEVGPGGGRWTRYLLAANKIYAVDFHQELLDELAKNYDLPNVVRIKNNGDDFPGIPVSSIDFAFSFGTFVHLDLNIIDEYLRNLKPLLKSGANVVIQYSDKTKPKAQRNLNFSENSPEVMRELVESHRYRIHEEDVSSLNHSAVIRFGLE